MANDYFKKLNAEQPTRMWVNNPWGDDIDKSIEAGVVSCTTNPGYAAKLLSEEPEFIHPVIDEAIARFDDDSKVAEEVVFHITARLVEHFLPLYEASGGQAGFVTIQDDPRRDDDVEATINAALRHRELGPNFMAKIPVIAGGCEAIEAIVAENIPICATEVFSISQAVHVCELYERAADNSQKTPPFYVTHIAGIFDQYLAGVVAEQNIDIAPEVLQQAGCYVSRQEYRLLKERGYRTTMLGGGARGTHHFTELVGGDLHVTTNWSTSVEIMAADIPVVSRIDTETPAEVVAELTAKLPDFRKAVELDGLALEDFADYGPVQLFRNMFLDGYGKLLAAIASRRP